MTGLVTVKYIYGPSSIGVDHDAIIGSSISGRIENNIGIRRLTTIAMPMKGNNSLFREFVKFVNCT
jgi:hypothetical protein